MIACGEEHSCFLTTENTLYACGKGDFGQLGIGYSTTREFRP
jgi:alpha-tubulin suppressor-like RCC1 family protein